MALTVVQAFNEFMANTVNLDPSDTKKAKGSREWLMEQMLTFPGGDNKFPEIYTEKNIYFGSFARSTKKRPLDDIDIMLCLKAGGCTYTEYPNKIDINVPNTATRFIDYINEGTSILNSRKVINAVLAKLKGVPQYKNAEIKRNMEAATLNLQSYDWIFDIVPCFFTTEDINKKTYYIIPDGSGNWKKTDPRLDRDRLINLNKAHDGNLLNVIRAVKYWNNRPTMPTMGSYLIENMVLDYYSGQVAKATQFVDIELVKIFFDLCTRVNSTVNDPKNIQGNLNHLNVDERKKISERAYSDYVRAFNARNFEEAKKMKESINLWIEIFGDQFPKYE